MDWLFERFKAAGDKNAFINDNIPYSYHWVLGHIKEYSDWIEAEGIREGDVVVVVGDYSPQLFCFMLALLKKNCIFAPLTRDSVVERSNVVEISECKWFIDFQTDLKDIEISQYPQEVTNQMLSDFIKKSEPGLLLFSSGSTGKPKAILHNFRAVAEKFKKQRSPVIAIVFLMFDHFGGVNTLFHILSSLGTVVTIRERSVHAICETIEKYKVELLPTTPSFLNMMVRLNLDNRYDLSSLKTISYGTEVMAQTTLERLGKMLPDVKLLQTYGLSELGVLRSQSENNDSLWVKLGGEGFNLKVVDDILWIKSDYSMIGYLNAPSPFDEEGWFNTQDRVEIKGDYFRILGRITDLINIGGQKVYPSEIEDFIMTLDNIEDVAVYAEKNGFTGNTIVAEVKLKEDENPIDLKKRIRKACLAHLSAFKVPTKVVVASKALYSSRQKKIRQKSPIA